MDNTEIKNVEATIASEVKKVEEFVVHVFKDIKTGIYHMVHPGLVTRPLDSEHPGTITAEVVQKLSDNSHGAVIADGQPLVVLLHDAVPVPAQPPADLTDPVNPAPVAEVPATAPAIDPALVPAPAPLSPESKN